MASWPSAVKTRFSVPSTESTATLESPGITIGLIFNVWGQIGVTRKQSTDGSIIGHPAERE